MAIRQRRKTTTVSTAKNVGNEKNRSTEAKKNTNVKRRELYSVDSRFRETLKRILPIGVIGLVVGWFIQANNKIRVVAEDTIQTITKSSAAQEAVPKAFAAKEGAAAAGADRMIQEGANKTVEVIPRVIEQATNNGIYFIMGLLFALILYLIFSWRRK